MIMMRADAKYAQIHSGITYSGTQTQDLRNLIRLNIISSPPDSDLKLGLGYEALRGPMTKDQTSNPNFLSVQFHPKSSYHGN